MRHRPPEKRPRTLRYYSEPLEAHPFPERHPLHLIEPAMAAMRNLLDPSAPILASVEDGIAALEIYTAMRLSADCQGLPISLPLTPAQRTSRYPIT